MLEVHHPTEGTLGALMRQELPPAECRSVLVHLVACEDCRRSLLVGWGADARQYLAGFLGPAVVKEWTAEAQHEPRPPSLAVVAANRLLDELETSSPAHGEMLAGNRQAYQTVPGAVTLLEEARRLWQVDPSESGRFIDAAETVLRNLLVESPMIAAAQLARCWAMRANVYRIRGALQDAVRAISEAQAWLLCCPAGPQLEKEIQIYEGLVRREQYGPAGAIKTLEAALSPPGPTGGYTVHIEATITLSHAYWAAEDSDKAIKTVEGVLTRHSRTELGDFLYMAALQNLALWRARSGQPAKARDILPALKAMVDRPDQALLRLRVTWVEAEVCKAEGNRAAAASLYRDIQQGFLDFNLAYDAAVASLDLALLHLEAEDTHAAKELAEELIPIFQSRDIHWDATVAGLVLVESLKGGVATVKQVREVAETLVPGQQHRVLSPRAADEDMESL